MADQSSDGHGTPEYVALLLYREFQQYLPNTGGDRGKTQNSLDLYSECLSATKGLEGSVDKIKGWPKQQPG